MPSFRSGQTNAGRASLARIRPDASGFLQRRLDCSISCEPTSVAVAQHPEPVGHRFAPFRRPRAAQHQERPHRQRVHGTLPQVNNAIANHSNFHGASQPRQSLGSNSWLTVTSESTLQERRRSMNTGHSPRRRVQAGRRVGSGTVDRAASQFDC